MFCTLFPLFDGCPVLPSNVREYLRISEFVEGREALFTLTFSLLPSKIYGYSFFFHADSTNRVFNVTIDTGSRSPVVTFQFLNGPVTSATCTIQYGTDPAYMYLPNTDSFNATNVNRMRVLFSAPLQTKTLYYCLVSSMGVQMQGTFRLGIDKHIQFFYSFSCMYHI